MNIRSVVAALVVAAAFLMSLVPAGAQSCRWAGTAPFCSGECGGNETEVARLDKIPDFWVYPFANVQPPFGASCWSGTKALCCSSPGQTRHCGWNGTAPFCDGSCGPDQVQATPPEGSSSGASCWTGSKVYCCSRFGQSGQALAGRDCSSGPGTCAQGFVWRGAVDQDHVCVTPEVRQQTSDDNSQAAARRSPTGGAFGPDTCRDGFVWRDAFPGDHVCVPPQTRARAAQDNRWAGIRNACP